MFYYYCTRGEQVPCISLTSLFDIINIGSSISIPLFDRIKRILILQKVLHTETRDFQVVMFRVNPEVSFIFV